MAKSNAERQAAHRARHAGESERLSMMVLSTVKRALEQLAEREGVTQRAMLEQVVMERLRQAMPGARSSLAVQLGLSVDEVEPYLRERQIDASTLRKRSSPVMTVCVETGKKRRISPGGVHVF